MDKSKQLKPQLESIVDKIDQLNTEVNQVLLNKLQHLDDKTSRLASKVENIIKRDQPTEGKQKRKSIDQSNDHNQKRRRLFKAKGSCYCLQFKVYKLHYF